MHTSFIVKDKKVFEETKYLARKSGYQYFTDYLWDAMLHFSKKQTKKVKGLAKWQYPDLAGIPTDVFDMKEWKGYIDSCEKQKLHKVNKLASDLIRLTDKRLMKK